MRLNLYATSCICLGSGYIQSINQEKARYNLEDCWLLSDASDRMEQPASLFLVLYSIFCSHLLLVSHEALQTMQHWLYQFLLLLLFLVCFVFTFLLLNQEDIYRSMIITARVIRRHCHISAWYTSDVFPVSVFWTGERKWFGAVFIPLKIHEIFSAKSKHGH